MATRLDAFHLDTPAGFRFCVERRPATGGRPRGTIVHVPAFAEEMNKSRRMVALAAEAWAEDGWRVLQIDPGGCGDSAGDLADASWEGWLEDVRLAQRWAAAHDDGPVWLWGLRLGGLLAAEAAARFRLDCGLLLWQPVTSGKQHLQQFLRLARAAQVVGKAGADGGPSPQQRLAQGETVEVAGYEIAPALARGMEAAQLDGFAAGCRVHWFQLAAAGGAAASPVLARIEADCRARAIDFRVHAVVGPSFWQTQEIEVAPDLLAASRLALAEGAEVAA